MEKITLVILAAGMGSRFGGLKQIEPVDPEGHIIIDFSLFDAWRAGFRDVVFRPFSIRSLLCSQQTVRLRL